MYIRPRRILKIAFWEPIFWPRDLFMQQNRTVWTSLIGEQPGIIPVEFGQIPISGLEQEVVFFI